VDVLIDTSVLVAVERGDLDFRTIVEPDVAYFVSVISAAELLHCVHRATGRRAQTRSASVEALLTNTALLPIDLAVARAYSRMSSALARTGAPVDANDLWIGATAIAHGLRVWSLDGDFDRMPGVSAG
jgi:predicted nucleic acid-binding protein